MIEYSTCVVSFVSGSSENTFYSLFQCSFRHIVFFRTESSQNDVIATMKFAFLISCLVAQEIVTAFLSTSTSSRQYFGSIRLIKSSTASLDISWSSPTITSSVAAAADSSQIKNYEYDGWNLTYRYKPASPGYENKSPILLIHPVGIGLSSWFWERFMAEWTGPAIYAPNLIGCGVSEGADPWDPNERGLSFPLGWAQGCEALMAVAMAEHSSGFSLFKIGKNDWKWTVVSQGGLAPVAVLMAARNTDNVDKLIMTSPPTWNEMVASVPEAELSRNYNFLRNPVWGRLAFQLLESRGAIEFFSNQFLFSGTCDREWLDLAESELGLKSRPPVISFNSGFCQHRSFEKELRNIKQSTLILAGDCDKRPRHDYVRYMKDCRIEMLPGLNVLPWEATTETVRSVKAFLDQ
jgi:pimeloyl-ACP methyl ester carboxylesterase